LDRDHRTVLGAARLRLKDDEGKKEAAPKKSAKGGFKELVSFVEDWAHNALNKFSMAGELHELRGFIPRDFPIDEPLTKEGRTALLNAAENGHLHLCEFLANPGSDNVEPANVSVKERKDHRTALMLAAMNNHTQVVAWLLSKGARVDDKDIHGQFPLMFVAEYCCTAVGATETAKMLLDAKAAVGVKDRRLNTPLHLAASQGGLEVATLLVEHGAVLTGQNINGKTPQEVAAKAGHTDLADYLGELSLSGALASAN